MGSTHHALEDFAVLKSLPNLQLFFPTTGDHVEACIVRAGTLPGPSYTRLGISGFPATLAPLHENPKTLTRTYAKGKRATVIGVGQATQIALQALQADPNLDVDLFGIARYPFDLNSDSTLLESVVRTGRIVILDEHYLAGSIAESLAFALPRNGTCDLLTARYSPDQKYGGSKFHLVQSEMSPDHLRALLARKGNA
jgi:transketolase